MKEIITSTKNEFVKYARSLSNKKGRKENEAFLAEGKKCVDELIFHMPHNLQSVILTEGKFEDIADFAKSSGKKVYYVTDNVLNSICDCKTPQGVAAIASIPSSANIPDSGFILALDDVQDPQNVGTMIRTADAAGCACVVMSDGCADCYSPKAVRASMGSIFHIPVIKTDLLNFLKSLASNYKIVSADINGQTDYKFDFNFTCLIIGNESRGISQQIKDISDTKIKIPMYGKAESLNAAVAAGILLYKIRT